MQFCANTVRHLLLPELLDDGRNAHLGTCALNGVCASVGGRNVRTIIYTYAPGRLHLSAASKHATAFDFPGAITSLTGTIN